MSIPRVKTFSSDAPSKPGSDVEKTIKSLRKPANHIRSRIPSKQGKVPTSLPVPAIEEKESVKEDVEEEKVVVGPPPRPLSKSLEKPAAPSPSVIKITNNKRILENKFNSVKNRYVTLRRDIDDKQKSAVITFEELIGMREKILAMGGKDPGKPEDILPRSLDSQFENSVDLMSQLEAAVLKTPTDAIALCQDALDTREKLIELLEGPSSGGDFVDKLEECRAEGSKLNSRLEALSQDLTDKATQLLQRTNNFCQERISNGSGNAANQNELVEQTARELRSEKEKHLKTRSRIRQKETALTSAEAKLHEAQETIKHLEAQLKQKETSFEQKHRELMRYQKNSDKLEKQNESIDSRMKKMREELEFKENESKTVINEHKKQIQSLEQELEKERLARKELETQFEEFKVRNTKLEEKCAQLLEMQESGKQVIKDDQHTEYEIQLFKDLKEAQNLLAEREEAINRLQIERSEIIAADQENDSSTQRLSAQLLTLKSQYAQLQKDYRRMQQKSEHLENKLAETNRLRAQLKDGSRESYLAQVTQLQQQLSDIRSNYTEAQSEKTELEKTCTQLQLKLEHYKRHIKEQDKALKVRREVQQLLQHHGDGQGNPESHNQDDFNAVNKEQAQQLIATLENKEMQIMKLEKLLKQMEKQDEYSQAQRIRLENRIANLELSLKESQQSHRYVTQKPVKIVGFENYDIEAYLSHSTSKSAALCAFQSKLSPSRQRYHKDHANLQEQMYSNDANYVAPAHASGSSIGHRHKRHLERDHRELHKRRVEAERIKNLRDSSKRGFPIKWLLKPFARENTNQAGHNQHMKYSELGRESRNRHYEKKAFRTINHMFQESHYVSTSQNYDL